MYYQCLYINDGKIGSTDNKKYIYINTDHIVSIDPYSFGDPPSGGKYVGWRFKMIDGSMIERVVKFDIINKKVLEGNDTLWGE